MKLVHTFLPAAFIFSKLCLFDELELLVMMLKGVCVQSVRSSSRADGLLRFICILVSSQFKHWILVHYSIKKKMEIEQQVL